VPIKEQDGLLQINIVGQDSSPEGWEDVMAAAEADGIGAVTAYPGFCGGVYLAEEDFSETYAGYMHALDSGPEALAEFKAAYPH